MRRNTRDPKKSQKTFHFESADPLRDALPINEYADYVNFSDIALTQSIDDDIVEAASQSYTFPEVAVEKPSQNIWLNPIAKTKDNNDW